MTKTYTLKNVIIPVLSYAFFLLLLYIALNKIYYSHIGKTTFDSLAFLTGAEIVKDGNVRHLYDKNVQQFYQDKIMLFDDGGKGLLSFRNPPLVAYAYIPFTMFSYRISYFLMSLLTILFISASIVIIGFYLRLSLGIILLYFFSTFLSIATWATVINGQITGFILLISTLIFVSLKNKNYSLAGILSGFLWLKPQFLIAIPLFSTLISPKSSLIKYFKYSALTISILVLIDSALYGVGFIRDYAYFLFLSEGASYGTYLKNNINLLGFMALFIDNSKTLFYSAILGSLISYSLLMVYLISNRACRNFELSYSVVCLALPIINIHTMITDLLLFLVPWIILSNIFLRIHGYRQAVYMTILFFVIMVFPGFLSINIGGIPYIVALLFILLLLIKYKYFLRYTTVCG